MIRAATSTLSRDRRPERMDDPGLDTAAHEAALRGLARLNRWSRGGTVARRGLQELLRTDEPAPGSPRAEPRRILDVASGAGDGALAWAGQARRRRVPVHVVGIDCSPGAVAHARRRAARADATDVRFERVDALREPWPAGPWDAVVCTLFLHHLSESDAAALLSRMRNAARSLVMVGDLLRCKEGYRLARAATRLLSRSPIVHHDGPVSVAGAFTIEEVAALAERAGLHGSTIERRWPYRFLLTWRPAR